MYAAVLADAHEFYYDRSLTRAQVMHQAMKLITDTVKQQKTTTTTTSLTNVGSSNSVSNNDRVYIFGGSAPLGSAIGYVHGNQICTGKFVV